MVGSLVAALTFAPAVLAVLRDPTPAPRSTGAGRLERLAGRLAVFDLRRRGWVLGAGGAVAALAVFGLTRIEVNTSFWGNLKPDHPLRQAVDEKDALGELFREVRQAVRANDCNRAILVGHNAAFDLGFLNEAVERAGIKRNPFHPFSVFDTVTLAGLAYGQTVLARSIRSAGMDWDSSEAHSAIYDAEMTAALFCRIVNSYRGCAQTNGD